MQALNNEEESKLWRKVKTGNEGAFQLLFEQYYRYLLTIAWRFLQDKTFCEDMAQEAFMELWRKRDNLPNDLAAKSYLRQIVVNKSLNHIKRAKKITFDLDKETYPEPAQKRNAQHQLEFRELQNVIQSAIDGLPDRCRLVYNLSRFEKLSHKEIAAQLNISTKTIETQITRALKVLRSAIKRSGLSEVGLMLLSFFY